MTAEEVTDICYKFSTWYGVHEQTIVAAVSEMIRKGGANKSTPPTFSIEIICPYSDPGNINVNIEKRDVIRAIEMVCPNKNFRNLADTLAPIIIKKGLRDASLDPSKDHGGDLAIKIGVRLAFQGRPPLTPQERVGCASYAQNVPNLDIIFGSDRITSLLAEDLQLRRSSTEKKRKGYDKGPDKGKNPVKNSLTKRKNRDLGNLELQNKIRKSKGNS